MKITKKLLKQNIDKYFKLKNTNDSNCIFFDGIGFTVAIFEFMQDTEPMYSILTRFKNFSDACFAAKIIDCNKTNYADCIKLIPNYDAIQI